MNLHQARGNASATVNMSDIMDRSYTSHSKTYFSEVKISKPCADGIKYNKTHKNCSKQNCPCECHKIYK